MEREMGVRVASQRQSKLAPLREQPQDFQV